tara:strand:+ start:7828 stop:8373 length:546 start_codon:yes stop_codon:yes gene_type:complete
MAITIPLIIGLDDLRFYLGITENFDSRLLEPLVIQSTDLAAQNVLGTALMIKLRNDYNQGTLSSYYQELYNSDKASVMKMVIWQTYVMALPRMLYKVGAETISIGDTDEVTSIGSEELGNMQRQATASKVFYENQVKQYLTQNFQNIPELSVNTPEYIRSNRTESYSSQGTTYSINKRYEL